MLARKNTEKSVIMAKIKGFLNKNLVEGALLSRNLDQTNKNKSMANIDLKTIAFPQSGGYSHGGKLKIGRAKIIKNPALKIHLNLLFCSLIFMDVCAKKD